MNELSCYLHTMARWLYLGDRSHFSMDDSSETAKTNSNNNSSNGSQQQIARNLEERKKGLKLDFSSPESTKKSLTTPDIINLNVEAFLKSFTSGLASEGKLKSHCFFILTTSSRFFFSNPNTHVVAGLTNIHTTLKHVLWSWLG